MILSQTDLKTNIAWKLLKVTDSDIEENIFEWNQPQVTFTNADSIKDECEKKIMVNSLQSKISFNVEVFMQIRKYLALLQCEIKWKQN